MTARALVVTADDLGLTVGVNRGIRRAHLDGIVTATSLLAVGGAFDDAVRMLRVTPTLDAGVHLALVGEDPPVLTATEVPTLVDRRGRFPLTYRQFLVRAATGRVDDADVRRELQAQLARVRAGGIPVTHLDTHQHVHLWPTVASAVLDLAAEHGIGHVRLPRSHRAGPVSLGVNALSVALGRQLRRRGLPVADYAGLDEAGAMDRGAIGRALADLAWRRARGQRAFAEINVHPGEVDADSARFAWGYRWAQELAALVDPGTARDVAAAGFALVAFSGLPGRPR
ncbi:MAG: ChbG/HpnK family deacetylase [Dermatophilaceae bacterium]